MWDFILNLFVNILLFIYNLFGNFGIAIILFTILIRVVTYPLTAKQIKGAQAMQDLQKDKRWIDIQAKYKNDRERLSQEQMKLYKELGVNPFSSCLPLLIQFPIIIALYQSLQMAMASSPLDLFNLMPRLWNGFLSPAIIPLNGRFLWMDMGQPERVNVFGIGIPVLAIIVVITTYMQSKLMQMPTTGQQNQSGMMSSMMNIYMPFLMGWLALTLSSGLALYFVVSNLLMIGQYALMGKLNWSNLLPGKKVQTAPAGPGTPKDGSTVGREKKSTALPSTSGPKLDKSAPRIRTRERSGKSGKK
jgi:YidC/Oxa1 family membrane protein insertase